MISNFSDGMRVEAQFLIGSASKSVNNLGSAYFNVELRDASGNIQGKKWDATSEDEKIFVPGNVISVLGEVVKYREALQLKILKATLVAEENIDFLSLLTPPPIPKEELIKRFNGYVESVKDPDCSALLSYFINKYKDKLYVYPAGVSVHHEYSSGLLTHLTSMAELGDFLAEKYQPLNRDLLITGILLHDIGKLIELEGPVVYKYSVEGKLLGHISIMAAEIREAADFLKIKSEIPMLLEHMVLSHHDKPEFGSPVSPMIKEALLLTMIDNMDSKMAIVTKALETVDEGEFTQKLLPLDGRSLYKHK